MVFNDLKSEYISLWNSCFIRPKFAGQVELVCNKMLQYKERYVSVMDETNYPWFLIGIIHSLESSFSFDSHLHNGSPLTSRTKGVPAGRPISGEPPFTWHESAVDAITYKNIWFDNFGPAETLFFLENWNGFGYRMYHSHVKSPYLWSMTNHYTKGKYVSDGTFSEDAISKQVGAAAILKHLDIFNSRASLGDVKFKLLEALNMLSSIMKELK